MAQMTKEKLQEVRKLLKRGAPEGEVREKLKGEGFTEEEIEQVFQPHKYDMRPWYLTFAILLALIGL
jgi:hypothetical protein